MSRLAGVIVIAIGVFLFLLGLNEADTFSSELREVFDGLPSTKAMALLIAGALLTLAGLVPVLRRRHP